MPGKVAKIGTFSDWVGLFEEWRQDDVLLLTAFLRHTLVTPLERG